MKQFCILSCFLFAFISAKKVNAQMDEPAKFSLEVTGADIAKPYFYKGLFYLYHQDYLPAAESFKMAELFDPEFVMAYWGEAMCYHRFVHVQHFQKEGQTALYKLAGSRYERVQKAKSGLEKDFLLTAEVLFDPAYKEYNRDTAVTNQLDKMLKQYPDNEDVLSFYALNVLDQLIKKPCSAKANNMVFDKLEKQIVNNPAHPGTLRELLHHYSIFAPEKIGPVLAKYQKTSGSSVSAYQFIAKMEAQLGNWNTSYPMAKKAFDINDKYIQKEKLGLDYRYLSDLYILAYALMQAGKYEQAHQLVRDMNLDARTSKTERSRYYLAKVKSAYVCSSNNWNSEIASVEVPTYNLNASLKSLVYFIQGMNELSNGNMDKVNFIIQQMEDQISMEKNKKDAVNADFDFDGLEGVTDAFNKEEDGKIATVYLMELQAYKNFKLKDYAKAEEIIKKAVELENSICKKSPLPVVDKPSEELAADMYYEKGDYKKAIETYGNVLKKYPKRSMPLLGLFNCHKSLGNTAEVLNSKKAIKQNWTNADLQVIGLIN